MAQILLPKSWSTRNGHEGSLRNVTDRDVAIQKSASTNSHHTLGSGKPQYFPFPGVGCHFDICKGVAWQLLVSTGFQG